jgi:tetratricopeptide (TPR) repeat protein
LLVIASDRRERGDLICLPCQRLWSIPSPFGRGAGRPQGRPLRTLKNKEASEKFKDAKKSAQKAIELSKGKKGYYNLACTQARLGELEEALGSLAKAKEIKGKEFYPAHAWEDDDLAPLRKPPYRKKFIEIFGPPPEAKPKSTKPKKK